MTEKDAIHIQAFAISIGPHVKIQFILGVNSLFSYEIQLDLNVKVYKRPIV